MSWPLASHFSAMLQNPRLAFRDRELKACRVETDARNQPRPWSGAFAVVFKGLAADGGGDPFAVRVFTTESPERRERYDLISAYLKTRRLSCLVDFEYRDESIRSAGDGKWYPLILMDWVEGETLFHWVRARCLEGNQKALAAAATRWVELVKELADAQIAHGDLQHANVMVTPAGQLKLVDYDCMCVPALIGRRNLEVGVEPYQHPDRTHTTHLSPELDNFSALVIYVALRALAADPGLWMGYVERPAYDKLLFRIEDFRTPEASPLYRDLKGSPADDVRELADKLVSLLRSPMDQVPALSHLTHSYARIEALLMGRQWEAAVDLLNRRGQFRDAPRHLKPLIHQAYEHVCRQQAWDAFQRLPRQPSELNDRKLVNAWNEALFAGFEPAEQQRCRLGAARRNVAVLDRLHHVVQQTAKATTLAKERVIAAAAKYLPKGYEYSLKPRVKQARQTVDAIRRLERALRQAAGEEAICAAWRKVVQAHCQHLVGAESRPRIELAARRFALIEAMRRIPESLPLDQLDRRLLDVWDETLVDGCPEAEPWRPAYEQAVCRKQLLDQIQRAINASDDVTVVELLEDPRLEHYVLPAAWAPALRAARDRVARTEALAAALRDGDRASFLQQFDARIIRRFGQKFAPLHSLLTEWTRSEVLPLEGLGLRPAVGRASLYCIDEAEGAYRVRWTWPQQRFADECILAVFARQPDPEEDPWNLEVQFRLPLDRPSWESGGGSRVIHVLPEWAGSFVVVWAMVDLGFRVLASHPLILGRLDVGKKQWGRTAKSWNVFSSLRGGKAQPPAPTGKVVDPAEDKDAPP